METAGLPELKRQRRNTVIYIVCNLLYTLGYGLCSDSYIQAYLLSAGMNASRIGYYGSVSQLCALGAYALFTAYRPKKGYMPAFFLSALLYSLYPVFLLGVGLAGGSMVLMTGAMLMAGAVAGFMNAVRFSCENCLVPAFFPRRHYGRILGQSGMLGSALATGVSLVGALALGALRPELCYSVFFATAAGGMLVAALITPLFRPSAEASRPVKAEGAIWKRIANRRFLQKLLPHFLRGIGEGALYYYTYTALQNLSLTAGQTSLIVTVTVVGGLVGNFILMRLAERVRTGRITQVSIWALAAFMLVNAVNKSVPVFFAALFLTRVAANVMGTSVPAGVMRSNTSDEMPLITPVRMFLLSGTIALCTLGFGYLIESIPPIVITAVGAAAFAAAGVFFNREFDDSVN